MPQSRGYGNNRKTGIWSRLNFMMKDVCLVNLPTLQDGRMHEKVALVLPPLVGGVALLAAAIKMKQYSERN